MNIYDFGWFDKIIDEKIDDKNLARITSTHKGLCHAISCNGEVNVYMSGRFHADKSLKLVTGDFVKIGDRFIDEQNKTAAMVEQILPRWSKLSRVRAGDDAVEQVLVSNLNYVFIVTSANEDFNVNRLQRYVLLAEQGGVNSVVILSKIDLVENSEKYISEIQARMKKTKIFPVSSKSEQGFKPMKDLLKPGVTAAFIGSSGVGKSTIVNYLMQKNIQKTLEVRNKDGKGRHATTGRDLFFLPSGGMVVDTAGLREVQVFAEEESIDSIFEEISLLTKNCKFSDCTHGNEPGCAINKALTNGSLSQKVYESYLKLEEEARHNESKINKSTSSRDKRRWKDTNQKIKSRKKFTGKK